MHPVERDDYVIPTNALEEFVNVLKGWILANVVGALVPGRQRIGKSYAIEYFYRRFREWFGDTIGVVSAEVGYHKQITETLFWYDLLRSIGRPTKKRNVEDRRELFLGRLVEAGSRSALKKVVIVLDEAHLLDDHLFKLLISLHNDLWRIYRIRAVWILVGQPELATLVETYLAEGKRQIVGRFMTDMYVYKPLLGLKDFEDAIGCYDGFLRYPPGGPYFTENYATGAWPAGYRLSTDAKLLHERIATKRGELGLPEDTGMTMQGFTVLMNHVLQYLLPKLKPGEHLTKEGIDEAIETTNCMIFEQHEALVTTA